MNIPGVGQAGLEDPRIRHKIIFNKSAGKLLVDSFDYYSDKLKTRFPKSYAKYFDRTALVAKATQTLQKIDGGAFMNFARTKIGKGAIGVAAGIVAYSLLSRHIDSRASSPAIPRQFDRGYDVLNETLTDFGSPVHLAKVASKIITPYKSSVRRAVKTTTNTTINKNIALYSYANAIKHSQY